MPVSLPKIAVFPGENLTREPRLWQGLAELFGVEFVPGTSACADGIDFAILLDATRAQALELARSHVRCLAYLGGDAIPLTPRTPVQFSNVPALHPLFRGRTVPDDRLLSSHKLTAEPGESILAAAGDRTLWIRRTEGKRSLDLAAAMFPSPKDPLALVEHFRIGNWAALFPLMHFLRELSPWKPPPLRACFMLDDPNLHWKSYGYVHFKELAQDAATHHYHVCFATIPADAWYVHPPTAAIFREHQAVLSLAVHGNDHTHTELARSYPEAKRRALVAQALHRIQRLEKQAGFEIPRVMTAPHGVCSEDMARMLLRLGFEAVSLAFSSMVEYNPGVNWPADIGLGPADFLGGGLPVIPRFQMFKTPAECLPHLLLSAFLGRPIIPVGHHWDLAGGLRALREQAAVVNSIGDVHWTDVRSIAETNYCTRREQEVLHLRLFSRRVRVRIPDGIQAVCVSRAWLAGGPPEGLRLSINGTGTQSFGSYRGEPFPVKPGVELEIVSVHPEAGSPQAVPTVRSGAWAIARRNLCEARDRLKPLRDRLLPAKAAQH
jgi:hypothetical protein